MMLAISPLESITQDVGDNYSKDDLFQDIDFSDLFMDFGDDGEGLPDLELDPSEILGELTANSGDGEEESCNLNSSSSEKSDREDRSEETLSKERAEKGAVRKVDGPVESKKSRQPGTRANGKNSQDKKRKVDWTPELHRRFVQAVEQLGIDKAVPSRILELMGIDCLTRHNIASHLQKYRSHRKHLKAKEVETISWNQRRSVYGCKRPHDIYKRENVAPWLAPSIGFPPPVQSFRPLHVWGHPTVDHTMMNVWPKHVALPQPPPFPQWAPQHQLPPPNRSFWHHPHYPRGSREGWVANVAASGAPCFPPPQLPTERRSSSAGPVHVIPHPHPTCGTDNIQQLQNKKLRLDMHPSGEIIDAAISEVLAKPWLPLPLRLKSPSVDSVLVELQRQGISKIPP